MYIVRGPELSLRLMTRDDAPRLFELASDPEVTRFFSWGPYTEERQAVEYVESLDRQREAAERLELGIVENDSGVLVGITGLSEFSFRDRRAVIGTWLGRAYWGTGVNTASKALLFAMAFRSLGFWRVSAPTNPDNVRSMAALERMGFVNEGRLRGWYVHRGEPRDVAMMRLYHDDWERTELARVPIEFEGEPPPQFVVG